MISAKSCVPQTPQSIFGDSPSDWSVDRIRDKLDLIVGGEWGDDPDAHDDGVVIPVVRVADIRGLDVNFENPTVRRVRESKLAGRLINQRTILLEKSGGGELTPVGRAVRVQTIDCDAICSNFMAKIDCHNTVYPSFVTYMFDALYSSSVNSASIQQTTGIQNLRVTDYLNTKVAFPLQTEQKRIAAFLDASCRAIDAAVSAKRRQIEVLDGLRKSTLQRVITRGLSTKPALKPTGKSWLEQIPDSWNLVMLKRLSEIQAGLTLGKTYDGPVIERPYLRVANVQDGYLDLDDITTIEVPPDVAKRVLLCAGDVLMTEGGDLDKLGRGYVWNGEIVGCLHQNHIFAVRCVPHLLLPKFLAYATASQYGRDYFEATGKRTTNLAATNSTKVGAFPIPLPPLSQQTEIVEFLDHQTDKYKSTQSLINQQISTLTTYRKSLIHECVTGQRRITEQDLHNLQERMTFDNK